jgi:nucleoside-diphosphate kinase
MSSEEETLVLIKPDALARGMCGEVLSRLEQADLRITHAREVRLTRTLLARHYAELRQKLPKAYKRNERYLTGKTILAFILRGRNAIAKTRALVGATDPLKAPPGTIRGDLSCDSIAVADAENRGLDNLVHAADSRASARREKQVWFG